MINTSAQSITRKRLVTAARILALLAVLAITVYAFSLGPRFKEFEKYGLPGLFLISIVANATIIIPVPGIALVFVAGAAFHPMAVAFVAGVGAAFGEISGYLAGFSGQGVVERAAVYQRIVNWMKQNRLQAYIAIVVLAFIPNPFFDLAGMASGALGIPVPYFLFFCAIGKIMKMMMFAYAGATTIGKFFQP